MDRITILFVCMGNICRSPLVEGIFRHMADNAGRAAEFDIDAKLALVRNQTVAMCGDYDWNLPHFPRLLAGLANAAVEEVRWAGVHPLHDLLDRSRTPAYADVLDRLARQGVRGRVEPSLLAG